MKTWYVHRGGAAIGPVSREEIAAAIVAGKVFDDDLFCEVGGQSWTTGDQVPELRELWSSDDMVATAERIVADSGSVPLDFDDLEPVTGLDLPALPPPGRPVFGQSAVPASAGPTAPSPVAIGPTGPPPELPPAPVIDEQAPTELFSRETLPPELSLAPGRPHPRTSPSPDSTVRTQRSEKVHRWVTIIVSLVMVALAVSLTVYALMTQAPPEMVTAEPTPRGSLPVPFDALSIGMTREALEAEFPPLEPLDSCSFTAVEDSAPRATESSAHSRCIHVGAVAGVTVEERERIEEAVRDHGDVATSVLERGWVRSIAHVRGSARAGLVEDRQLLEAHGQTGASLPETVFGVSSALAEGNLKLFSSRSQQRHVGAMLDDDCEAVVAERVAAYTRGELEMPRRSRCSRRLGRQQARFAANILEAGGAIAAIGLPRASGTEPDRENPRTLRTLIRQSELDEPHVALIVHLANRADELEAFFQGAIVLVAEEGAQTTWSHAIAWLEENRVTRLLLSLNSGANIDRLESFLGPELGHVSSSDPTHVHWDGDGWKARLDHAALALIIEAE